MEEIQNTKPKTKKKRWFLRIIYLLFIIFLVVDFFFFFLATPILKSFLQQKVSEQTQGLFSVNFKRISIELGSRRLALEDFELIPDTLVYNQIISKNGTKAALYKISCSSVELWRIGAYRLFFKGKLKASDLKLIKPIVELKKLPQSDDQRTESRDFVHEDLFPAIEPYLSEIIINNIVLDNGKFFLSLKKDSLKTITHFGNISIKLNQFYLDKLAHKEKSKLFFSEGLQIEVEDYKINLSDKIHFLYADYIIISTKNSRLLASNVGINTIVQKKNFIYKLKDNHYRISSPQIEFNNFDIYNLYFNSDIQIGNIVCQSPDIELVNKFKLKSEADANTKETLELDLSSLIKGKLNSIKVDTFKIENGKLKFYHDNWFNSPTYQANSITLDLFKFQLDEKANFIKSKLFYSDNINLLIDSFTAVLPDKSHIIRVNEISLSSKEETIDANEISISKKHIGNASKTNLDLDIYIPSLHASGTNFFSLYHDRLFNISRMSIGESDFKITLPRKSYDKGNTDTDKNALSIITKNFLKQLKIRNFVLNQSYFRIVNSGTDSSATIYSGKAIFELNKFAISNEILNDDKSKLFYSENFNLKLSGYSQDLDDQIHQLSSKSLEISTIDSLIELDDFLIKPKQEFNDFARLRSGKKLVNFSFIQAFIRGVDINKTINDSILEAASISIFRPAFSIDNYFQISEKRNISNTIDSIEINRDYRKYFKKSGNNNNSVRDILASYFKKIDIQTLTIEKADIYIVDIDTLGKKDPTMSGKISARLNKFYFVPQLDSAINNISYSENISFRLNDYFAKFSNKKYQLKIKQASFSSHDSSFVASLIRVFPSDNFAAKTTSAKFWSFYIPEIKTNNSRIDELFDYNILDLGSISIQSPSVVYTKPGINDLEGKNGLTADTVKKNLNFSQIKFDEIEVKNGVFGISKRENNIEEPILKTSFSLQLQSSKIDSTIFSNPKDFINNLSALLSLSNLHFQTRDSLKFIEIDKVELNTSDKNIYGNGFRFVNRGGFSDIKKSSDLKEFKIPEFSFSKFESDKLLFNKEIKASMLIVKRPFLNLIKLNKDTKIKSDGLFDFNIYDKIKNSLKVVDIEKIVLDSASASIVELESLNTKTSFYNNIYGNISNFFVDSGKVKNNSILNSEDISLGMRDYEVNIIDNLYKLNVKDLGFSSSGNSFFAKNIALNPNIKREDYFAMKQKESVLSYTKVDEIIGSDVSIMELFNNRNILARKFDIYNLQFQSYKNKQYPMDSILKVPHPLDYINKMKRIIKIDTIDMHNAYVSAEILGKNAKETGFIDFTKVNAKIANLNNDFKSLALNQETTIKASGYLIDKSLITASMHIPIDSKNKEYIYGGSLDTFDVKDLNPYLENLFFVSIQDGIVNNINFTINLNEDYALGKLNMEYHNLKLDLLSIKKTDSLQIENRGLFSLVANSIIKDSNPRHVGGYLKEGRVYFERNVYKPVINYWILAPVSGMQSTLGFKSKQLKERLKIENNSKKFENIYKKRNRRIDRRSSKTIEKQIEKELKDESKNRMKEKKKEKKNQKNKNLGILNKPIIILNYLFQIV